MQEAFQHGFMAYYKDDNQWQVLPDKDFYQSLEAEGAEAYEAVSEDGQRVGGAIITANGVIGELAFLYVKVGVQSKGIGQAIWKSIEAMHPEIEVWETCTHVLVDEFVAVVPQHVERDAVQQVKS